LVGHGVDGCEQPPFELQPPIGVRLPFEQMVGLPHWVPLDGNTHDAATPLQYPAHEPEPPHGVWPVRGASLTKMHVPNEPGSLHERHCSVQSLSQQYPSAQWFDVQSELVVHV
jgi:hypothetical protein